MNGYNLESEVGEGFVVTQSCSEQRAQTLDGIHQHTVQRSVRDPVQSGLLGNLCDCLGQALNWLLKVQAGLQIDGEVDPLHGCNRVGYAVGDRTLDRDILEISAPSCEDEALLAVLDRDLRNRRAEPAKPERISRRCAHNAAVLESNDM
ncbi:hypothetical protein BMS3Bbin02_01490 [bacterium BMS3Bbin02]|nr:hypothetical protein BMS3Bbin02_01490 [bacterium BMS3Bbin02]